MPLPTDDTTPPVTKMNFGVMLASLLPCIKHHHLRFLWQRSLRHAEFRLRDNLPEAHLMAELFYRCEPFLVRSRKVHRNNYRGLNLAYNLGSLCHVKHLATCGDE